MGCVGSVITPLCLLDFILCACDVHALGCQGAFMTAEDRNVQFCVPHHDHASRLSVWGIGGYCPLYGDCHGRGPEKGVLDEEVVDEHG